VIQRVYRQDVAFLLFALVVSIILTRGVVSRPNYTDAYYYFNAANRLASGDGLTDAYLWTYIGAPDYLPAPSHLYWMPLTSLIAGFGMWVMNSPGSYAAAQWPFTLMFVGVGLMGYWLGRRLGGKSRHAWIAGILTLFSGFYSRFWGMTDTFTSYALVGGLCLLFLGLAVECERVKGSLVLWGIAGLFAGLGHLTRADGLLLIIVGLLFALVIPKRRIIAILVLCAGYLLVMMPWFVRNLSEIGTILPVGGTQAAWYTDYNDLFNYPPGAEPGDLFSDGLTTFIESRWLALTNNFGTFLAVEGMIVLAPLMLIGLWKRRKNRFLWPFTLYAIGLHLAMTVVFPFPGFRGGLFHSAAALVPFWAALGVVGLDDTVDWIAKRRRKWQPRTAKWVFSTGLVVLAVVLTFSIAGQNQVATDVPSLYTRLQDVLPPGSRVMINDPAQLYYFIEIGGVVIPNARVDVLPEIATTYEITHLLIEFVDGVPAVPGKFVFDFDNPPSYLQAIYIGFSSVRLYAIQSP